MSSLLAIWLTACLAGQSVPVRFVACAANRHRLTWVDARTGRAIDYDLSPAADLDVGPRGVVAACDGDYLVTLEADKMLRLPDRAERRSLVGWLGERVMYTAGGYAGDSPCDDRLWDPASGQVSGAPDLGSPWHVQTLADGYLAMCRSEAGGSLVLYGPDFKRRREWRIGGGDIMLSWRAMLGGRYAIMEYHNAEYSRYLWVVDLTSDRSQRIALPGWSMACAGRTDHELIMAEYGPPLGAKVMVWAVDVEKRTRQLLLETSDFAGPYGLSDDQAWLLGSAAPRHRGRHRLVALRLADGFRQELLPEVWDCVVVPPQPAANP